MVGLKTSPMQGPYPRDLNTASRQSMLSLPTFIRRTETKADMKQIEDMELLMKKQIIKLMKEKEYAINKQNRVLKKVSLHVNSDQGGHDRVKRLVKMGDLGLRIEEITLGLERRYESMFCSFDAVVTELQTYLDSFLNNQKKEIFSSLVLEKNQNHSNFQALEARLFEVFEKGGEKFYTNEKTFSAFTEMLEFTKVFRDDFYSLISSRLTPINLKELKSDLSRELLNKFNSMNIAPRAFPSELLRFFEQKDRTSMRIDQRTLYHGTKIKVDDIFPEGMNIDRCLHQIPLHLVHKIKSRENPRSFSILGWLDKSSLVVASNCQLKIFSMSLDQKLLSKPEFRRLTQQSQLQYDSGRLFDDTLQIQCIEATKFEGHSYILLGCNRSVDLSDIDR